MADRPRVFLDVSIGEEPAGRLLIELFADKAPRTAENFRQLCTGEHNGMSYAKIPFHRVIDEFMIQGGDVEKQDGTGTASIYGRDFDDENLDWRELDAPGLLCSANRGKNTNGSQFFITLEPCPHLNGKHTVFGRLVSGHDITARIAKLAVDSNDTPIQPVLVSRCGELERKRSAKKHDSIQENAPPEQREDRGRRRKSDQDGSDEEMEDDVSPPERTTRRRRQSDNVVDEGIRGRPRLRSGSRSRSPSASTSAPLVKEDGDTSSRSPVKMHKRKRSPSPSRHVDRRSEQAGDERRRRSLPNQYRDDRDEDRYRPSPRRDGAGRRGGRDDRYRPSRDRFVDEGRLDAPLGSGDGGGYQDQDPPVKFKGRGVMKYREPDRAW